jgi:hypothetical protein
MQFRLHRNNNGWLLKSDKAFPLEEAKRVMKDVNALLRKEEKKAEKKAGKDAED